MCQESHLGLLLGLGLVVECLEREKLICVRVCSSFEVGKFGPVQQTGASGLVLNYWLQRVAVVDANA